MLGRVLARGLVVVRATCMMYGKAAADPLHSWPWGRVWGMQTGPLFSGQILPNWGWKRRSSWFSLPLTPKRAREGKMARSAQENILAWLKVQQFSDGDVDPLASACYKMRDVKNSPLLGEEKVSEGQKNELLKENLCMCHIFHNC